jgi:hypothetical protein
MLRISFSERGSRAHYFRDRFSHKYQHFRARFLARKMSKKEEERYDEIVLGSTVAACYLMAMCEIGRDRFYSAPLLSLWELSSSGSFYAWGGKMLLPMIPRGLNAAVPIWILYHCYRTINRS